MRIILCANHPLCESSTGIVRIMCQKTTIARIILCANHPLRESSCIEMFNSRLVAACRCRVTINERFLCLCKSRLGGSIMILTCLSVRLFVRSTSITSLVNTMFWKLINRFGCKLAPVVYGAMRWNGSSLAPGGCRSRSHDVEVRFGDMAEA